MSFRARFGRRGMALYALVGLAALTSCERVPYCLNCGDADIGSVTDARARDVITARDTGARTDTGVTDGCTAGAQELCNGVDDNCNGQIDEGIDLDRDPGNCGRCGNRGLR